MEIHPSPILEHCPLCQVAYVRAEIRLLNTQAKSKLYHCTCRACGHAILAVLVEGSGWLSSVGVLTDLEASDAKRLPAQPPISSDECIEIRNHLQQKSRDMCRRLLARAQS